MEKDNTSKLIIDLSTSKKQKKKKKKKKKSRKRKMENNLENGSKRKRKKLGIPDGFIKKNSQPAKIILELGYKVPKSIEDIPCKLNRWYEKLDFYGKGGNDRKIIQRAVPFIYFLHSKLEEGESFKEIKFSSQLIIDYIKFSTEKNIISKNSVFEWLYAVKMFLCHAYDLDYDKIPGNKRVDREMKKIKDFAEPITSVDAYNIQFFKDVWNKHPEEGEDLLYKILTLGPFFSPIRENQLDKCVFENMTHDVAERTISFFEERSKTGKAFFVITDAGGPRYSVYRLMVKYLGMISERYKVGGVWRHWCKSKYKSSKGYYPPGARLKTSEFTTIRKKMERLYLCSMPADVFYEEVTKTKLPNRLRSSNLNSKFGLNRFGSKSKRKSYATLNSSNSNLSNEELAQGYWKSVKVFKDSYQKYQTCHETSRHGKISNHYWNLGKKNQKLDNRNDPISFQKLGNRNDPISLQQRYNEQQSFINNRNGPISLEQRYKEQKSFINDRNDPISLQERYKDQQSFFSNRNGPISLQQRYKEQKSFINDRNDPISLQERYKEQKIFFNNRNEPNSLQQRYVDNRNGPISFTKLDDRNDPNSFQQKLDDRNDPNSFQQKLDNRNYPISWQKVYNRDGSMSFQKVDNRNYPISWKKVYNRDGSISFQKLDDRNGPISFTKLDDRNDPNSFQQKLDDRNDPNSFQKLDNRNYPISWQKVYNRDGSMSFQKVDNRNDPISLQQRYKDQQSFVDDRNFPISLQQKFKEEKSFVDDRNDPISLQQKFTQERFTEQQEKEIFQNCEEINESKKSKKHRNDPISFKKEKDKEEEYDFLNLALNHIKQNQDQHVEEENYEDNMEEIDF